MTVAVARQASNAWRVLAVLFLANLFNFFDRAVPAIVLEPMRKEWSLSDLQLGIISAAFTVVYAVAGIPLGRLADTRSRKTIMGLGLIVWSGFTAAGAAAGGFVSFLLTRIGVGIGEASYAPAATALIGDLFPANKRSRAMGIFMLGLPLGLLLAFFTVGAMVKAFGSWRAPFVIAMIPGLVIALLMFTIREPERGAAETHASSEAPIANPIRKVLGIRTMWWIILAGIAANFAAYATNAFMVPLMQRFFGLPLEMAAVSTGVIVGLTGLVGLTAGGWVGDRMHERSDRGRLVLGAVSLLLAAIATWFALTTRRRSGRRVHRRLLRRLAAAIYLLHQPLSGGSGYRRTAPAGDGGRRPVRRALPARRRVRPDGRRLPVRPLCRGRDDRGRRNGNERALQGDRPARRDAPCADLAAGHLNRHSSGDTQLSRRRTRNVRRAGPGRCREALTQRGPR